MYYLGPDGYLQHDSLCFSSDDNNHCTSFLYQVQTILVYYLKANHPHIPTYNKLIYFFDICGGQYKNYKNFMDLCSTNKNFAKCFISVNECLIRKAKTRKYSCFLTSKPPLLLLNLSKELKLIFSLHKVYDI